MVSVQKVAIFEPEKQEALLRACSETEFIPVWLMMRCGMHIEDIVNRNEHFRFDGTWLLWRRSKTGRPRKVAVPPDVAPRLERWLKKGKRLTHNGYHKLVRRVGERAGLGRDITPMTLRHTFGLEMLRRYRNRADAIDLVATMMGATPSVVRRYYVDLTQWERLGEG